VDGHVGAVTLTIASDLPHGAMHLDVAGKRSGPAVRRDDGYVQRPKLFLANDSSDGLVHDAEHGHHIAPLRLVDELGDDLNIVQRSLRIGHAHGTVHEVEGVAFTSMVVP
jgi:hypothetical protein